jgi:hypothetical protein
MDESMESVGVAENSFRTQHESCTSNTMCSNKTRITQILWDAVAVAVGYW